MAVRSVVHRCNTARNSQQQGPFQLRS